MTLGQAARVVDMSRSHLINACRGRFGLSQDRVAAFKGFIIHPPPIRQRDLFGELQHE